MKPKLTVLMPVYNSEAFLKESIESILGQSYTEFEFLIINDGSSDNSEKIITSYSDRRIRYHSNGHNLGLVDTLNTGLNLASGNYVARMDADDISLFNRLETQVAFLDQNPDVAVCGTSILPFETDKETSKKNWIKHHDSESLRISLLFNNQIAHPTVMLNLDLLKKVSLSYESEFYPAEDYHLWVKIGRYYKLANLPEILLKYRLNPSSITNQQNEIQIDKAQNIVQLQLVSLGIYPTLDEMATHALLCSYDPLEISPEKLQELKIWSKKIMIANKHIRQYDHEKFSEQIHEKILSIRIKKKESIFNRLFYKLRS